VCRVSKGLFAGFVLRAKAPRRYANADQETTNHIGFLPTRRCIRHTDDAIRYIKQLKPSLSLRLQVDASTHLNGEVAHPSIQTIAVCRLKPG